MDRFREMELMLAIADAGSFAKAAKRLNLSPPAVTRMVSDLETRLDTRLIQRTTRSMHLTEAGLRYLGHAKRVVEEVEMTERDLMGTAASPRGHVRVTVPTSLGRMVMPPIVRAFLQTHPDVTASMLLLDRVVNLVEEGIDIALRIGDLPDSSLIARRVGTLRRVLVASPDYLAEHGAPSHPRNLAEHSFVGFSGIMPGRAITFQEDGKPFRMVVSPRIETNDAGLSLELTRQGQGITSAISYMVAECLRDGSLVEVLKPYAQPARPVHLIYPESRLMASAALAFLDTTVPLLKEALSTSFSVEP